MASTEREMICPTTLWHRQVPRRKLTRERHAYQLAWPVPPFFASSGHSRMSSEATTRLILSGPAVLMTLHVHAFFSLKV